jgi:ATP-dependent RNA helicase RhlE
MSGGEIGDVAAVEHLLGYRIARVHVPGFSFHAPLESDESGTRGEVVELPPTIQEQKASRGRRLGARSGKELTPEELAKLLKVG